MFDLVEIRNKLAPKLCFLKKEIYEKHMQNGTFIHNPLQKQAYT